MDTDTVLEGRKQMIEVVQTIKDCYEEYRNNGTEFVINSGKITTNEKGERNGNKFCNNSWTVDW